MDGTVAGRACSTLSADSVALFVHSRRRLGANTQLLSPSQPVAGCQFEETVRDGDAAGRIYLAWN